MKNQKVWVTINNARSAVRLLILIRNLQYNKSDRKRSIMATGEVNFNLYLCAQGGKTTDECYKIFASTVDIINANGGNAGLYPSVFKKYFQPMQDRGVEDSGKELAALLPVELKAIQEVTTLSTKEAVPGAYMVCIFLLLADDERYGPLKM